jgi:hypothetical protein
LNSGETSGAREFSEINTQNKDHAIVVIVPPMEFCTKNPGFNRYHGRLVFCYIINLISHAYATIHPRFSVLWKHSRFGFVFFCNAGAGVNIVINIR